MDPEPPASRAAAIPRRASILLGTVAAAIYLAGAEALYGVTTTLSNTRIPVCACGDQAQEVWFLGWSAHALASGHSLLFSRAIDAPVGVNLVANTAMPLLGIALAPVTWLLGPVAAYNLGLRLALVASAMAMYLLLRRWTRWWPAALLGGAAYGFSTFMTGQAHGHLFLTFAPCVPLILWFLDDLLVGGTTRRRALRSGLGLGIVVGAEFWVSPEVLALTATVLIPGAALLVLRRRRELAERRSALLAAGAVAGAAALAVVAVPLWYLVAGPQHLHGPPHPVSHVTPFSNDLLGSLLPTSLNAFAPTWLAVHTNRFGAGNLTENGAYLGIPLVVLAAWMVWRFARPRLRWAAAGACAAWVLSLGPTLVVANGHTGLPMPEWVLTKLPLLQDVIPARFTLLLGCFAAVVAGVGLDEVRTLVRSRRPRRSRIRLPGAVVRRASLATLALGVAVLVPLAPAATYAAVPTRVPAFYSTPSQVGEVPPGSVVLTYPFPIGPDQRALLDQSVARMHYAILGGVAFTPGPGGATVSANTASMVAVATANLVNAQYGNPPPPSPPYPDYPDQIAIASQSLRSLRVRVVLMDPGGVDRARAIAFVTDLLGPPRHVGGVDAWFDVPAALGAHGR